MLRIKVVVDCDEICFVFVYIDQFICLCYFCCVVFLVIICNCYVLFFFLVFSFFVVYVYDFKGKRVVISFFEGLEELMSI